MYIKASIICLTIILLSRSDILIVVLEKPIIYIGNWQLQNNIFGISDK